ncbi:hypothetical protein SH668x_003066 [Planctomicrobium sp. SH668]|uniref:hypothetical protein n=1 Tax=Planctomicrobium sp. SH668 TaxID=3448126 RepID=UPI003F5B8227
MSYNQLTVLIPSHGLEDLQTDLAEKPASSLLNSFAVLWHPKLIAKSGVLPNWQRADAPQTPVTDKLVVIPLSCQDIVPPGWIERTRNEGGVVVVGEIERSEMLAQAFVPLEEGIEPDPDLAADFMAFGTTYLLLELLTRKMRSYLSVDEIRLKREMIAAAEAAMEHDDAAARKHLKYCYELLLECRERFYPVDCYLIDLCLVIPDVVDDSLNKLLEADSAVNLFATASDWQTIVAGDPAWKDRIQSSIKRKIVELIGGDDVELTNPLMSLDASLFHLRSGRKIFEDLFGSRPVTFVRKRFGLGPHIPQLIQRLGYVGALHVVLDDGSYPDEEQSQIRWQGSDGTTLDAISRIPLPGDGATGIFRFPERMSESMDMDHVAAVVFARWPDLRTPYLEDLRRGHRYAPVFGTFVRLEEYFLRASGPCRTAVNNAGDYLSPALIQTVATREADPVSRFQKYWDRERRYERADWTRQIARLLKSDFGPDSTRDELEVIVQAAHPESTPDAQNAADAALEAYQHKAEESLLPVLTSGGEEGPGVLVVNSLSFPRKALIQWPQNWTPGKDPDILGVQTENGRTRVLVNLPPSGFVWFPAGSASAKETAPGKTPLAEDLLLRNEFFEVRLSPVTGGISGIQTYQRSPNRISQQVCLRYQYEKQVWSDQDGEQSSYQTHYTSMQMREFRILSAGPLIGEIETLGDIVDDSNQQVVGTFRQSTRVVRGKNVVEVDLEISPAVEVEGNPWLHYYGCRFAWKHEDVAITASMQQGAHQVLKERIEAPQYLEIADDNFRTTILTPGLPFHRKTGERMLDTILIPEGESKRTFNFAIAIDSNYPMQSAIDQYSEPVVIPTSTRPREESRTGWFFGLSAANVQIQKIIPSDLPNSVVIRLLETEGRGRTVGLQCFRTPRSARQLDFEGNVMHELITDDAVNIEMAPYGFCDVELSF